jgi:hypothetical protein
MMALDDLLVIPYVASRRLGIPLRQLAMWIGSGIAVGLTLAGTIHALPVPGFTGFLVELLLGAVLLAAVILLAWRATAVPETVASGENAVPSATDS